MNNKNNSPFYIGCLACVMLVFGFLFVVLSDNIKQTRDEIAATKAQIVLQQENTVKALKILSKPYWYLDAYGNLSELSDPNHISPGNDVTMDWHEVFKSHSNSWQDVEKARFAKDGFVTRNKGKKVVFGPAYGLRSDAETVCGGLLWFAVIDG